MAEHIVAIFSTEGAAAAAARDLENVGFSASAIRRYSTWAIPPAFISSQTAVGKRPTGDLCHPRQ
jgi:hypothetical protein